MAVRSQAFSYGGHGGLDPCHFQQMNKIAPFVVHSLYQKGRFPKMKMACLLKFSGASFPAPFFLPSHDKNWQQESLGFRATIAVDPPLMDLKNNSHRLYLLIKSFEVPFFMDWTPALDNSWLRAWVTCLPCIR